MFLALVGRPLLRAAPLTAAERATVSMDGAVEYMRKYREAGGQGWPPQADFGDTTLTPEELDLMREPSRSAEHNAQQRALLPKIAADPKRGDVARALESTCRDSAELVAAYTPEVHEQLRALIAPLKALVHDVDDRDRATLAPPVRAIGMKLHELGGKKAQEAVYYGVGALLYDQVSYCDDGDTWSETKSSLRIAWDGCGQWMA